MQQLLYRRGRGRSIQHSGEEIYWIPDALEEDEPVQHGEQGHRDAASQSTFDTSRDGVHLERQPGTLHLLRYRQPHDFARRSDYRFVRTYGNAFMAFVR